MPDPVTSLPAALLLAASALAVLLLGGGVFVRSALRVAVSPDRTGIFFTCYASLALALGAVGTALGTGAPLGPVLALAALPLLLGPTLAFIMHRRKIALGEIRVQEGDCMPAWEALRADGSTFDSQELHGQRVLLKVFRGHWCPFCAAELRQFDAMRPELEAHGIHVIALSKDAPEEARYQAERDGLGFPLLCDPELKFIRQLGLEHRKAIEISGGRFHIAGFPLGYRPSFETMAIPTTFLLDERGRIRWIDQSEDYQVRGDAARVREAVEAAFGPGTVSADGALPALPPYPGGVELAPCG